MRPLTRLYRDKKLFFFFVLGTILPLLFAVVIHLVVGMQLGGYLLSIFEKKAIDNLELYHTHAKITVQSYLNNSIHVIEGLAQSTNLQSEKNNANSKGIEGDLRLIMNSNPRFLTVGTMDPKGKVTHILSRKKEVETLLGQNLSYRDYFTGTIQTKKTYLGEPTVGLKSKITQINMCSPALIKEQISEIVCGFISLEDLTKNIDITSSFYDKFSILVDKKGTVLVGNVPSTGRLVDLRKSEPLLGKLMRSTQQKLIEEEFNFQGDRAFAIGEKITIANRNYFLLSFQNKDGYLSEKRSFAYTLNKTTVYLIFGWLALCIVFFIILSVVLDRYERHENER
jgi:hypothetical protein